MSIQIGQTLSTSTHTLEQGLNHIKSIGGRAIQYFISPPQNRYVVPLSDEQVENFNSAHKNQHSDIYVVVHGKYIVNFCHPFKSQKGINMRDMLVRELVQAARIGCNVILHQGKNVDYLPREIALQNYVDNVVECLKETKKYGVKNKIVLENSSHQGTEIGYSLKELSEIWNLIPKKYQKRISFCLDTCHIFASGTYDLRKRSAVKNMFEDFAKLIGLEHLEVIHFNDSLKCFDSHVDKHADILCGYIGMKKFGGSCRGFRYLTKVCTQHNIPIILETSGKYMTMKSQIDLLTSWCCNDTKYEKLYRKICKSKVI